MSSMVMLQIFSLDLLRVDSIRLGRSEYLKYRGDLSLNILRGAAKQSVKRKSHWSGLILFMCRGIMPSWLHDSSKHRLTPADSIGEQKIDRSADCIMIVYDCIIGTRERLLDVKYDFREVMYIEVNAMISDLDRLITNPNMHTEFVTEMISVTKESMTSDMVA